MTWEIELMYPDGIFHWRGNADGTCAALSTAAMAAWGAHGWRAVDLVSVKIDRVFT